MSDTSSLQPRYSLVKAQDFHYNGYSYAGETTRTLKSARRFGTWRSLTLAAKHIFLLAVVITTIVLVAVVGRIPHQQSTSPYYTSQFHNCNANGTFTPNHLPTFSLWDGSGLFQITLKWRHMTFSQAN